MFSEAKSILAIILTVLDDNHLWNFFILFGRRDRLGPRKLMCPPVQWLKAHVQKRFGVGMFRAPS